MIITVPVVFILLEQPNWRIFLYERARGLNNDRFDGLFALPGGKVEPHETMREAASCEAYKEIGITIDINDLEFIHLGNHCAIPTKKVIAVVFRVRSWRLYFICSFNCKQT